MRADAGDAATTCAGCHAPLEPEFGKSRAAAEGVTCEACHLVSAVQPTRGARDHTYDHSGQTEYGPLCDAKDHYFHKMGCAPVYKQGEFCGGCHLYHRTTATGTDIPVFTAFTEWKEGGYEEVGLHCQDCHMPTRTGKAAPGTDRKIEVAHHGTMGHDDDLTRDAITVKLKSSRDEQALTLVAKIHNRAGGHALPTGLPARRLVLRVRGTAGGKPVFSEDREYGRILTDSTGAVAPFYAAAAVARDTRIRADETRVETFSILAPSDLDIQVELVAQAYPDSIAKRLGVDPDPGRTVASVQLPANTSEASSMAQSKQAPKP